MKKIIKTLSALALALILLIPFASCGSKDKTEVRIMLLNGTTAMGMAPLMNDIKNGTVENTYKAEIVTSADIVSAAVIAGEVDIAAVPSNLAAVLYKKTEGAIRIIAANTLGVLYVVENGETVTDFASLAGKTVYLPAKGSNPEYIFGHILEKHGIADKVTLDFTYNSPDALASAVVAGEAKIALLPEPKATVVTSSSPDKSVRVALDCTAEWEKYEAENSLVQGCLIATEKFVSEHAKLLDSFLADYKKSVDFVNSKPDEASVMIADNGIIPKAGIAKAAIPRCNICCLEGDEMKNAMKVFFGILGNAAPKSLGGSIPDDNIYYIKSK